MARSNEFNMLRISRSGYSTLGQNLHTGLDTVSPQIYIFVQSNQATATDKELISSANNHSKQVDEMISHINSHLFKHKRIIHSAYVNRKVNSINLIVYLHNTSRVNLHNIYELIVSLRPRYSEVDFDVEVEHKRFEVSSDLASNGYEKIVLK